MGKQFSPSRLPGPKCAFLGPQITPSLLGRKKRNLPFFRQMLRKLRRNRCRWKAVTQPLVPSKRVITKNICKSARARAKINSRFRDTKLFLIFGLLLQPIRLLLHKIWLLLFKNWLLLLEIWLFLPEIWILLLNWPTFAPSLASILAIYA